MTGGMQAGDEIKCPHCGQWHVLQHARGAPNAHNPDVVNTMLYFGCAHAKQPALYFAGYEGTQGRFERRSPKGGQT